MVATTLPLNRARVPPALSPPGDLFVAETIALFPNSPEVLDKLSDIDEFFIRIDSAFLTLQIEIHYFVRRSLLLRYSTFWF